MFDFLKKKPPAKAKNPLYINVQWVKTKKTIIDNGDLINRDATAIMCMSFYCGAWCVLKEIKRIAQIDPELAVQALNNMDEEIEAMEMVESAMRSLPAVKATVQ